MNRTVAISADGARSDIVYSAAGRIESITHANGARSEYQYDPAGRIEGISHRQGGSEVARFGYTYDDRGNRLTETRVDSSGEQSSTYSYDRDDRLTEVEVVGSDGVRTQTVYTLDAVGNRLSERVRRAGTLVADISYRYQAHQRLLERSDAISGQTSSYDYDGRGHLISETTAGQTTVYRPNAQDRLATLTLPGAPPVSYRYDSEGKRVERRSSTELTRFGWDGAQLRRETNAANNLLEAHDWAAGRILQSRRLTHTRYAQHDALNSPTRWSQANGAEQGQLRYDAWGTTTDTSAELPRIAYTGHYRERDGSAYYAQQRYYRPGLGRFNRVDPWGGDPLRPVTLNKYLYANGNPLYYTDPTGMYGEAGHYYTTYYVAMRAGFTEEQAQKLAFYSQLPDEVDQLDAIGVQSNAFLGDLGTAAMNLYLAPSAIPLSAPQTAASMVRDDVQTSFHSLLDSTGPEQTAATLAAMRESGGDLATTGLLIHRLGDSFAHCPDRGACFGTGWGHAVPSLMGTDPDVIQNRPSQYLAYVDALAGALGEQQGMGNEQVDALRASLRTELRDVAGINRVDGPVIPAWKPGGWMDAPPSQVRRATRAQRLRSNEELQTLSEQALRQKLRRLGADGSYAPETLPGEDGARKYRPDFLPGQTTARTLGQALADFTQATARATNEQEALAALARTKRLIDTQRASARGLPGVVVEGSDGDRPAVQLQDGH